MTRSANASCVRSWTSVRLMKDILHVHEVQFYHYQAIIKLVGTRNKQRAQLLACAMSEIRSRHGENEVVSTERMFSTYVSSSFSSSSITDNQVACGAFVATGKAMVVLLEDEAS
mmetsp:Transcript_26940/g.61820  ORF Transcript_26940/g.61820 Transcript_26940/m.61820 type:complete len:114 (-) Transcript_26940:528-869(-)